MPCDILFSLYLGPPLQSLRADPEASHSWLAALVSAREVWLRLPGECYQDHCAVPMQQGRLYRAFR